MKQKLDRPRIARGLSVLLAIPFLVMAPAGLAQCPPYLLSDFDSMRAPLLPTDWVASQGVNVTGAPLWVTTSVTPDTAPNAAFSTAPDNILDNRLDTPELPGGPDASQIYFENNYDLESGADGAVIEVSHPGINGGAFTDITDPAVAGSITPGYNALITSASSPIAGRMAWTGNSGGYVHTVVNLGNAAAPPNSGRKLRFRLVTDNSGASAGWRIDNVYAYRFECPSPAPTPPPTPTATPIASPCGSPNVIADSTFEAGAPWSNWTVQTSTNFGTPLCNTAACGTGAGTAPPYAGDNWAWFGGANVPETATLGQNVPIMAGGPATLSFVMRRSSLSAATDVLNVRVDGTVVQSYAEASDTYSLRTVDLSAFADGNSHLILFEYVGPTTGTSSFAVDNVTVTFGPACPTPTPSPTATPSATVTPTPTATASPTATPSPGSPTPCSTNVIVDGSFENGGIPSSTWDPETSTNFGTPLCDFASCGNGAGESPPRTGLIWLWFGGISAPETATLGQTVTIPAGDFATLHFWMRVGTVTAPFTDVVNVRVDGAIVQSFLEPAVAEANYTERVIDLSAFADGAAHALLFEYIGPSSAISSFVIDDVTLLGAAPGCPSPSPTVTPPPSPTPAPPTPTPTATPPPPPAQALNISTRLRVEAGERVAIGGFIITGSEPKRVALRGLGPSLSNSGLSDVLADPTLELRGSDGALITQNDNWQDEPLMGEPIANLGLAPQNPNESALVATLPPGAYTAMVAGKNQTSGLALVEVYDVDTAAAAQLANISTRGFVRTADNVMIGGFILGQGSASVNVVVRGLGPSLGQSGLTDVLSDPTLELHDGNGALLVANDNWQDDPVSAAQLSAHGLAPSNALESGIFTTLTPGLFTALLAEKNGGVGLGLVEVYVDVRALIVTSTADSGPGSLRDALAVAEDGDTIQFAPALNGQTITLISSELLIDKSITIRGPMIVQRSMAEGTPAFRIFRITPGHTVTMNGLTISNGFADMNNPSGGGVFNDQSTLTLGYCAVEHNSSAVGFGGGIYNSGSSAILTVAHSTVTGNFMEVEPVFICCGGGFGAGIYSDGTLAIDQSTVSGNGIGYLLNNFAGDGGGIYSSGGAVISNSSVSGNFANRVAGGIFNRGTLEVTNSTINYNESIRSGGGIYNEGTLAIDNATFTANVSAELSTQGAGIYNQATMTLIRTTFSENSADGDGGNIFNSGALQIGNTILKAQSGGGNILSQGGASTVTSLGYNLSSDNGGGFLTATGDQINTDPMLGPLRDNGGPNFTHTLLTGSPAINAGDPAFTPPPYNDQRGPGYDRVVGGRIDVGAFEVQP